MGKALLVPTLLDRIPIPTVVKVLRTRRNVVVERGTCVIDRLVLDTRGSLKLLWIRRRFSFSVSVLCLCE